MSSTVFASKRCGALFSDSKTPVIKGLFAILKNDQVAASERRIKELAKALFEANVFEGSGAAKKFNYKEQTYELIRSELLAIEQTGADARGYQEFKVMLNVTEKLKKDEPLYGKLAGEVSQVQETFRIRTNGQVAFLHNTWTNRPHSIRAQKALEYKAVYFDGNQIKSADQGEIIISSLPDSFNLSRAMSEKERLLWLDEKAFASPGYGQRIHFAPQYFYFNRMPYFIPVTKKQLFEAYRRGEVEINTYENMGSFTHVDDRRHGEYVIPMWMGDLKLEFEIVFVGEIGVKTAGDILRAGLKQQNLDLQFEQKPVQSIRVGNWTEKDNDDSINTVNFNRILFMSGDGSGDRILQNKQKVSRLADLSDLQDNSFDLIVMNKGLGVCKGKVCGGVDVDYNQMQKFLFKSISVLDKNNPRSLALFTGFNFPVLNSKSVADMWIDFVKVIEIRNPQLQVAILRSNSEAQSLTDGFVGIAISTDTWTPIGQQLRELSPRLVESNP